jgi:glucosamine kinase
MSAGAPGNDLFVGVDGGATKTLLRLEDAQGRVLGEGRGGAANIRLSVEGSWRSIREALAQATSEAGLNLDDGRHRLHCGAGLAGTEVAAARDRFLAAAHPFARLVLRSDGYTACFGAHGGGDGAVIAVGTGTIGFQVEARQESRVGGWGFPHGDEGSGAWLGLEAVRRTLHWLDGRAPSDPLLEAIHARFDGDLDRLVVWANGASATEFAQVAPLVVEHAGQGTPLALALAREAAGEVDRIGRALAAKSRRPLPCCLLGGLGRFIEPWLEEALRARLVPCKHDAVQGALLMARADPAGGT